MGALERRCLNDGAPGIDGVTFEDIEESGAKGFLQQIRDELTNNTYRPMRVRKKEIPKEGGKVRILSIPSIRDRVVQGALKLILEPIFEADFQAGSYGYRPKRGVCAPALEPRDEGEGSWTKCQGFKPDLRNSAVRHYRGGLGKRSHGGIVNPPCNRKGKNGNPSPTG